MVTLVRVLALLVCGLTLTPPGVCLCHAFEPADATSDHDDHTPGCPAAEGGKQLQRAEPATDVGPIPAFTAFVGVGVLPLVLQGIPPDRPAVRGSHSPPLYLSHCALVL